MSIHLKLALKENMEVLQLMKQAVKWRIKEFNYDSDRQESVIIDMMIENQIKFTKF